MCTAIGPRLTRLRLGNYILLPDDIHSSLGDILLAVLRILLSRWLRHLSYVPSNSMLSYNHWTLISIKHLSIYLSLSIRSPHWHLSPQIILRIPYPSCIVYIGYYNTQLTTLGFSRWYYIPLHKIYGQIQNKFLRFIYYRFHFSLSGLDLDQLRYIYFILVDAYDCAKTNPLPLRALIIS